MPFIPCPPLARFQFTPLREGRRRKHLSCTQVSRFFQFTPLREGRHEIQKAGRIKVRKFQFTPLREGRRFPAPAVLKIRPISIHAPPRGATRRRSLRSSNKPDFNSRPSARGDDTPAPRPGSRAISIHAPPRGATSVGVSVLEIPTSFQFTPLREGRRAQQHHGVSGLCNFNSRPSARGDIAEVVDKILFHISIHAPPRGATLSVLVIVI